MINQYSDLVLKYRWICLGLITLCLFGVLGGLKNLKSNYHMRYWLEKDDSLIKRLNYFEDNFGNDETVVIAFHNPSGILNVRSLEKIQGISDSISQIKDVKSTQSLLTLEVPKRSLKKNKLELTRVIDLKNFNLNLIKEKIHSINLIPNLFISDDYKTTVIFATLNPTIINNGEVFQEIEYRGLTKEIRTLISKHSSDDFEIHVSGTPILQNDFSEVSEKDLQIIMPLLFIFLSLVLFILTRSIVVLGISILVISLTNTFVYGIAGHLYFQIENMLSIVPLITLTICLADIIHIYMTYQQKRLQNNNKESALKMAISENFVPTFLTSLTTGIGFFSLYSSKLVPVSNMGVLAGVGVLIAWVLSISLFPILLSFGKNEKIKTTSFITKFSFSPIVNFSKKYSLQIISFFILLTLFGGYVGTKNQVNTDPITFFKKDTDIRRATDFILSNLGAISGPELIVHSGYREGILEPEFLNKVDKFGDWLLENKYIDKTISIVSLGKELYKAMNGGDQSFYRIPDTKMELVDLIFDNRKKVRNMMSLNSRVSTDFESIRLSLLWSLTDTKSSLERLKIIKGKAKEMGLSVVVTGKNALYLEMNDHVVSTFFSSIGFAILFISFLMMVLFRSFKFGIIAMLPNIIPLAFVTCIMTITGIHIDIGTALVCSVCLGIAVDDTIHFMINYYRAKKTHSTYEALNYVMDHTGKALLMTSFILVIGFGFFMFSDFIPNIKFGFLCSLTMCMALITDFFLLPAVLLKLDK